MGMFRTFSDIDDFVQQYDVGYLQGMLESGSLDMDDTPKAVEWLSAHRTRVAERERREDREREAQALRLGLESLDVAKRQAVAGERQAHAAEKAVRISWIALGISVAAAIVSLAGVLREFFKV